MLDIGAYWLDSNQMITNGRSLQALKMGGYIGVTGPNNVTISNNYFSHYVGTVQQGSTMGF